MNNLITRDKGTQQLQKPFVIVGILLMGILFGLFIGSYGIAVAGALIGTIVFIIYFTILVNRPQVGLFAALGLGFVLLGSTRYIETSLPIGMLMDAVLMLTFAGLFFHHFPNKINWKPVNKDITYLAIIWLAYCIIQVANPEARSFDAWFAALRPIGLYFLLFVVLSLFFLNTPERLRIMFIIWGVFSLLASIKGATQLLIGVDPWEKAWLDGGASITHVLFGRLRVFSFFSDAGQFGANQAYSGVVFAIIAAVTKKKRDKLFFIVVSIAAFYGMFISGTRGALFVPFAAFTLFFFQKKNILILTTGMIFGVLVFSFFKFTTIGQGNYQISRMRTAFDPEDASLQVRLENQKRLKVYLATRPIGGGLGHGGVKAQKYLPNAYLSNVATDSWYVLIWVELGIVGLLIHLFIQFYTLGKGSYYLMFRLRDPVLIATMSALSSGMLGIMLASYGNAVIGQLPTSPLIYSSMAIILNAPLIDKKIRKKKRLNQIKERSLFRVNKLKHP